MNDNIVKLVSNSKKAIEKEIGHGSSGEPPMEARVAKLEAHVEHIQSDIKDIKSDIRSVMRFGITAFLITWAGIIFLGLGLSGLMAKGFGWLN